MLHNANVLAGTHLSPIPVGVGVRTRRIWAVDQTLTARCVGVWTTYELARLVISLGASQIALRTRPYICCKPLISMQARTNGHKRVLLHPANKLAVFLLGHRRHPRVVRALIALLGWLRRLAHTDNSDNLSYLYGLSFCNCSRPTILVSI